MGDHFDLSAPGMHTSDTIDYGVVVRGEMTLELDDGQLVHLRQGDCIVQNGTRHRWRNPLAEPCLMAFISVGGQRGCELRVQRGVVRCRNRCSLCKRRRGKREHRERAERTIHPEILAKGTCCRRVACTDTRASFGWR